MASIHGVGARFFVARLPDDDSEPSRAPPVTGRVTFGYQLFADLQTGTRVMSPQAGTLGLSRAQIPNALQELGDIVLTLSRHPELPAEYRQAFWDVLLPDLERFGVQSDAEAIDRLPFTLEAADEVHKLLA